MLKITKKGNRNFWHFDGLREMDFSTWQITLNETEQNVILIQENGAPFPKQAVLVGQVIVVDETDSSVEETFTTTELLRERLIELGYNALVSSGGGGGAVDSVNGQTGVVILDADDINETTARKWLTSTLKTAYDGAVSWIATNGTNLLNHLTNTSNPHSTTASQVGAYTTSQVDTALGLKADKTTTPIILKNKLTNVSTTSSQTVVDYVDLSIMGTDFSLDAIFRAKKVGVVSTANLAFHLNSTPNMTGTPITIASSYSDINTRLYHPLERFLTFESGFYYGQSQALPNDLSNSSSAFAEPAVDISVKKYLIVTITRGGTAGDTVTSRDLRVIGYPKVN